VNVIDSYQVAEPQIEKLSSEKTPSSDYKTPTEIDLEKLENKLRTVKFTLEILIGVCATLPEAGKVLV
jgi:hypothetical protein